jgi:hypothetical protein
VATATRPAKTSAATSRAMTFSRALTMTTCAASSSRSPSSFPLASRRRASATPRRRGARATRRAGNGDAPRDGEQRVSDEELREAIRECRELLEEATRMAGEQARAELTASFLRAPDGVESGLTGNLAIDMARVQLFFQGKGMRQWEAERVSRTLVEIDSVYHDVELLAVKYDRLVRTLPGVDVKSMVATDARVMATDIGVNVERMITMADVFPKGKVPSMISEAPRLLYCDDLTERVERTIDCIKRVYPKETDESCMCAIIEEPTLLFELPDLNVFKERVRIDIAELPMTTQEMLVFATRNENE